MRATFGRKWRRLQIGVAAVKSYGNQVGDGWLGPGIMARSSAGTLGCGVRNYWLKLAMSRGAVSSAVSTAVMLFTGLTGLAGVVAPLAGVV